MEEIIIVINVILYLMGIWKTIEILKIRYNKIKDKKINKMIKKLPVKKYRKTVPKNKGLFDEEN